MECSVCRIQCICRVCIYRCLQVDGLYFLCFNRCLKILMRFKITDAYMHMYQYKYYGHFKE